MNILTVFLFYLKNFLFPSVCALCGKSLVLFSEIKYGLCEKCGSSIKPVIGEICRTCGKPLVSEIEYCLQCRNGVEHSYNRQWLLFPYTGKYRELMKKYKFEKNLPLADFFAEKIKEVLNDSVFDGAHIVPVPPRPGKIKDTGWDQVDYLVKRLEKLYGKEISVNRCLRRRKSKVQKRLNRTERIENLKGRIFLRGSLPKTAVIIDDVTTTGSTMEICSSVLKEYGTEIVYGICLFYD
jgi:ComF family protein